MDDTLAELVVAPSRYRPTRGDPIAWLVTIARHKLVDTARAIARRRQREVPLTDELAGGLQGRPGPSWDDLAERGAWVDSRRHQFLGVAKTEQEKRFLAARLRRAPLADQASLLCAEDLPQAEQRALVNRVWKRLRVRLLPSLGPGHKGDRDSEPPLGHRLAGLCDLAAARRICK